MSRELIVIGFETSGALRRRFREQGYDCVSIDLLPAEDGGAGHIVGDFFQEILKLEARYKVRAVVAHPPCTYLTNSAAWAFKDADFERYPGKGYHQKPKPGTRVGRARRVARQRALDDVRRIIALPCLTVIENPIGAIGTAIEKPHQIVQPYQFGDDASKATCLWYHNERGEMVPGMKLTGGERFPGRWVEHNGKYVERWSNQTDSGQNRLGPRDDRWKDRSRTYNGIANAIMWAVIEQLKKDAGT